MTRTQPEQFRHRARPLAIVSCTNMCTAHPDNLGEEGAKMLHDILEAGYGGSHAQRELTKAGHSLSRTAIHRHVANHIRPLDKTESLEKAEGKRVPTLEILDAISEMGYKNRRNWRPTIQDVLKAEEMRLRLTGGSLFDAFLDVIDAATFPDPDDPEAEGPSTDIEAALSPDERPNEDSDDLEALME
jgi:hypothetical protein